MTDDDLSLSTPRDITALICKTLHPNTSTVDLMKYLNDELPVYYTESPDP